MVDFNAGAVFLGFRTNTAPLVTGFTQARKSVENLGDGVKKAAGQVAAGADQMDRSLDDFTKKDAKRTASIANLVSRMVALQIAVQNLAGNGSKNLDTFGRAVSIAGKSIAAFAITVSLLPTKAGLIIGAVVGIATAIGGMVGPTEEETAALEKLNEEILRTGEALEDLERKRRGQALVQKLEKNFRLDAPSPENLENDAKLAERNRLIEKLIVLEERRLAIRKKQEALSKQIREAEDNAFNPLFLLKRSANDLRKDLGLVTDQAEEAFNQILETEKALGIATQGARDFKETLRLADSRDAAIKNITDQLRGFDEALKVNADAVQKGLITPLDGANERAQLTAQRAKAILDFLIKIKNLPPELLEGITLPTLPDAVPEAIDEREKQRQREEVDRQARGLASSIGQGVREGILTGASALETLGIIGQNVFENFLTQTIDKFQTGMAEAFKSIVGVGGEAIGGLLTGLIGVAGAIFARKNGSSKDTFGADTKLIDSSQAVRGIVSGPQNVAIAAVGENLKRALVGVEIRLDAVISILRQIRNGASGGPGGSPEIPFAGSVSTS